MDFTCHVQLLLCVFLQWPFYTDGKKLSPYILDYRPLEIDHLHVAHKHHRVKRSLDPHLQLNLRAYGRNFNLKLKPIKDLFTDDHMLHVEGERPEAVDTSYIYKGVDLDSPGSRVHLAVLNDSLYGHIVVPGERYHLDPARKHIRDPTFHTIVYKESRMNMDPFRHKRHAELKDYPQFDNEELFERLREMSQPVEEHNRANRAAHGMNENIYSAESNGYGDYKAHRRVKREWDRNKATCALSLQADKLFVDYIKSQYTNRRLAKVNEEIIAFFASHVDELSYIYSATAFKETDEDYPVFLGVTFQIQRSVIIQNCSVYERGYCKDNLDVSNFLDLTSRRSHNDFCLTQTFTYRDFVGGTLGLAWVAAPSSPSSGICGKFRSMREKGVVVKRSLNTGVVTIINFRNTVPNRVSQITLAHEVGHNFGSPHDQTEKCAPYGTNQPNAAGGNYIMFPSATSGFKSNNVKFSTCSKDKIAKVLATLSPNGRRDNCFTKTGAAFCGNGITEEDEQCDCGFDDTCIDTCCNPRKADLLIDKDSLACKLRNNSICSPTAGKCCTEDCTFNSANEICQAATDCTESVRCTGKNEKCPEPKHKQDYIFCNDFSKTCYKGECAASLCSNINWTECYKKKSDGATSTEMCFLACENPDTGQCIGSYEKEAVDANPKFSGLLSEISIGTTGKDAKYEVKRPAGSICNNFRGYCDVFTKCRDVDAEGPFKQLTNMIFGEEALKLVEKWVQKHWWAVMLMVLGVVVFMGVFVKIFGYNTPSENPDKPKARPPRGHVPNMREANNGGRNGRYKPEAGSQASSSSRNVGGAYNYGYQESPSDPPPKLPSSKPPPRNPTAPPSSSGPPSYFSQPPSYNRSRPENFDRIRF